MFISVFILCVIFVTSLFRLVIFFCSSSCCCVVLRLVSVCCNFVFCEENMVYFFEVFGMGVLNL